MSIIDDISRRSREKILAAVAQGYHDPEIKSTPLPDPVCHVRLIHEGETAEEVASYTEEQAQAAAHSGRKVDLLATFKSNVIANKFDLHECTEKELMATINGILKERHVQSLMYPRNLGLKVEKLQAPEKICFDRSIDEASMREQVFHTDASIINCELGVASHGVVMVCSSPEQPRLLSLAMPTCIMLLRKEKLVESLIAGLHTMKATHETLPTNILYIAGPSRTSDIELITVFGVHGPQQVHLVLY